MKAWDVVGYTFRAETICPETATEWAISVTEDARQSGNSEAALDLAAKKLGVNRADEYSFDSDDFPKVIFAVDLDPNEMCDCCRN